MKMGIRKARLADVPVIQTLVNTYADEGKMLAISKGQIFEQLRDFYVYAEGGEAVGVCALRIIWDDLAEIRSLAVRADHQQRGFGRQLVEACLDEARSLGFGRIFALTYQTDFFVAIGFHSVDKHELPHKVWKDCLMCVKFPDCDEEAVVIDLGGQVGD